MVAVVLPLVTYTEGIPEFDPKYQDTLCIRQRGIILHSERRKHQQQHHQDREHLDHYRQHSHRQYQG